MGIISKMQGSAVAPMVRGITQAGGFGRYFLAWGGVNEYAEHSAWSMSGYGDRIYFSFTADAPGTGVQQLIQAAGGLWHLRINDITGVLQAQYRRISDDALVVVTGPTLTAGVKCRGYIEYAADGVTLAVDGETPATSTHAPKLSDDDFAFMASNNLGNENFSGAIHYLRYTNATPLQNTNAVKGNGVDLWAQIPELSLTDFELRWWGTFWPDDNRRLFGKDANNRVYINVSSGFTAIVGGTATSSGLSSIADLADGQHYHGVFRVGSQYTNGAEFEIDGVVRSVNIDVTGNTFTLSKLMIADANPIPDGYYFYDVTIIDRTQVVLAGNELLTNGTFVSAAGWTIGTGWSVFGGSLSHNGAFGFNVTDDPVFVLGEYHLITFDVSGNSGGSLQLHFCNSVGGTAGDPVHNSSANGSFSVIALHTEADSQRYLSISGGTFNGSIDNVSVKQVTKFHTIQYDMSGDSGSVVPNIDPDSGTSANGTWQNYDSGTDQVALPQLSRHYPMNDGPGALFLKDRLTLPSNFDFVADNLGTGWSDAGGGQYDCDGTQVGDTDLQDDSATAVAGDVYQFTYIVSGYTAGSVTPRIGNAAGAARSANGTYTELITASNTDAAEFRGDLNFDGSVSGISIQNINTGAELFNVATTDWSR